MGVTEKISHNPPTGVTHTLPVRLTTRCVTSMEGELSLLQGCGLTLGAQPLTLAEGVCASVAAELLKCGFPAQVVYAVGKVLLARVTFEQVELPGRDNKCLSTEATLLDLYLEEALVTGTDVLLQCARDGMIQLVSSDSHRPHPQGGCVSFSLLSLAMGLLGEQVDDAKIGKQTLVSEAEAELLSAARDPIYKEVQLVKAANGADLRWDLLTKESGVASPQELHRLINEAVGTPHTISVTGQPGQRKTIYTLTRRRRFPV
jgi:glutaredoxin-related protein